MHEDFIGYGDTFTFDTNTFNTKLFVDINVPQGKLKKCIIDGVLNPYIVEQEGLNMSRSNNNIYIVSKDDHSEQVVFEEFIL